MNKLVTVKEMCQESLDTRALEQFQQKGRLLAQLDHLAGARELNAQVP